MSETLIRVGHSAYKGTNAYRLCFSRAQAVRVLCNRGFKRDAARAAVKQTMEIGGATGRANYELVEVANEAPSLQAGYFYATYKQMRADWRHASEL